MSDDLVGVGHKIRYAYWWTLPKYKSFPAMTTGFHDYLARELTWPFMRVKETSRRIRDAVSDWAKNTD
jgi:hypothetical protein